MSNILEFPEKDEFTSGYIMTDGKKIDGIYMKDLAAYNDNGDVFVGEKQGDKILNPVVINKDKMNRFCIMWLAIYDPDVLVEDE